MDNPDKLKDQVNTLQGDASFRPCPTCGLKLSWSTKTCPNDGTVAGQSPKPGSIFKGKYEFVDIIGEGGMSVVYRARDKMLGRTIAIKLMHMHMATSGKQIMRFQQEAKTYSLLSHPHIIAVHEFGTLDDGQPFLIMDYAEGESLAEMINSRGRLPLARALGIFVQVADALSHAHRKNVIHRDLKPSNIMLCRGDRGEDVAKVVDFGIAKILQADSEKRGLTQTGEVFGSPPYMSPEQCAGWTLNNSSDIYSMGCLMFEALTGKPPFIGESMVETVFKHMNEPAPRMVAGSEKFPEILEKIIAKTLEKDPLDRYQSMDQLRDDLQRVLDECDGVEHDGKYWCAQERKDSKPFSNPFFMGGVAVVGLIAIAAAASMFFAPPPRDLDNAVTQGVARESMLPKEMPHWRGDDLDAQQLINNQPNTEEINLDKRPITDRGFVGVSKLKRLRKLSLVDSEITDKTLKELGQIASLRHVDISKTHITDAGLKELAGLPLESLNIAETRVTAKGLQSIAKMTSLRTLNLSGLKLKDADLMHLSKLRKLQELVLDSNHITGPSVSGFSQLNLLDLRNNPVSDAAVPGFVKMKNLSSLDLSETGITDNGAAKLAENRSIQSIALGHTNVGDHAVEALLTLPRLRSLNVERTRISNSIVPKVAAHRLIENLNLNSTDLSDKSVSNLAKMTQLKVLNLGGSGITDAGLAKFGNLRNLVDLSLDHTLISDKSMPMVAKFRKLHHLNISSTPVTSDGVILFKDRDLPLRHLETKDCPGITDEGLSVIRRAKPNCTLDRDVLF